MEATLEHIERLGVGGDLPRCGETGPQESGARWPSFSLVEVFNPSQGFSLVRTTSPFVGERTVSVSTARQQHPCFPTVTSKDDSTHLLNVPGAQSLVGSH